MSRLTKVEQIIELAMMFQNSYCGLSINDIKEHFECSRRSAERMKALLFDLFPEKVEEVPTDDKTKRWRFTKGTVNMFVSFTANDFANLEYLKRLSNDDNRHKQIDELIEKIKTLTPQKKLISLDNDVSAILETEGFAVRQYSRMKIDSKKIISLRCALLSQKKIKFKYEINNEYKQITLDPYGIIICDKYYLVGFNEYVKDLRLYKIDKINDLILTEDYFEKDEKFNLQEYYNNSFGIYQETPLDISIEFNKQVADEVLHYQFHPTQTMKELDNGNVLVKFVSGGKHSICQELFKWGSMINKIEPVELKNYYKEYITNVLSGL